MRTYRWNGLTNALVYFLVGFILWTCAEPVTVLTILNSRSLLIIFILVMMAIFYLRCPSWLCMTACGLMILYGMHYYFFHDEPLLSLDWLISLGAAITSNLGSVLQGKLLASSDLFSAFLFFVLLGLIMFAIRHWLRSGSFVLFVSFAVLSLALIDTFTYFDGNRSMVAVIVAALILLIVHKWQSFSAFIQDKNTMTKSVSWFAASGALIFAILVVALSAPKLDTQWSLPSSYLSSLNLDFLQNGSFFSGSQRIGYDENDTRLGGSLGMDSTPVFTVSVSGKPGYWRVVHKDDYTGQGWGDSNRFFLPIADTQTVSSTLSLYENQTRTTRQTAILRFTNASPAILPYTGQPEQVSVPDRRLKIEQATGQVLTDNERKASIERLTYAEPVFQTARLRQATSEADPEIVRERNLQLPETLPDRVRELGQRLTAGKTNRYDQVKAVVDYLRSSRFRYSTDQIPRPASNQDYVDQFLFETRVGYCDNFSTSMVVLLRSAGIPARWVKGFTSGEYQGQVAEKVNGKTVNLNKYQITNANAHSWGEVYFPGSGWVTFEPTPSFSDPSQFASASSNNDSTASDPNQSANNQESKKTQQNAPTTKEKPVKQTQQAKNQSVQEKQPDQKRTSVHKAAGVHINWTFIGWTLLVVCLAGALASIFTRKKWLTAFYLRRIQHSELRSWKDFYDVYHVLLRILNLHGLKRSDTETLREFAERVCSIIFGNELFVLTKHYERLIYEYDTNLPPVNQEHIRKLINELTSHLNQQNEYVRKMNKRIAE